MDTNLRSDKIEFDSRFSMYVCLQKIRDSERFFLPLFCIYFIDNIQDSFYGFQTVIKMVYKKPNNCKAVIINVHQLAADSALATGYITSNTIRPF